MIFLDITKSAVARHRSGLLRVGSRLGQNFGLAAAGVVWPQWDRAVKRGDWFLTPELFSESERPGFTAFLEARPCRFAAIFHDAIPLKQPHITWPQSVARHPEYMKMLASFERTWAISDATRRDFTEFWRWQGVAPKSSPAVIELGADFDGSSRVQRDPIFPAGRPALLCVGIVEPRKNQTFLLDVAEALWGEGVDFQLDVVGRVNPHFGGPIVARMKKLERREARFRFHDAAGDRVLARLYADGAFRRQVEATFEPGDASGRPLRYEFHLAPPLLARRDPATGEPRKISFGPWILTVFRLLTKFKFLRGTAFDPFGYSAERKTERQLIADYEYLLGEICEFLTPANHHFAVGLAAMPEKIRGFGPVKQRHLAAAKAEEAALRDQFLSGSAPLLKAAE